MPGLIERRQEIELARSFLWEDRSAELAGLSLLLGIDMCEKLCACERRCMLLHPHVGPHECCQGHLWAQG